jgi:hypothetical protein
MKSFAAILAFVVLACVAIAESDEKPIRVSGIVSLEEFAGPPNYESVKDGDALEKAWILITAKKERFHLVVLEDEEKKFATLRRSVGKRVRVEGTLWPAETGHHRTPFLITVRSIEQEPNQTPEPTPPSVTPRADARVAPAGVVAHL